MNSVQFEKWLNTYGECWEKGDAKAITSLFSDDAYYYETPFDEPMIGHSEIEQYWSDGADQAQKNVVFHYTSASIIEMVGTCRWKANFSRVPSGINVEIDGYLEAHFNGDGKCTIFREWWHIKESTE